MRIRDLRYCFAFFLLHPLVAEDVLLASSAPFHFRTAQSRDVLLRDDGTGSFPGKFPLPPGGQELELQPTTFTPYDRYFANVRAVIAAIEPQHPSMATASHLMKIGYSYQYLTRDPYRPDLPKLTEAQRAGDCKSKALWLFDNLADAGALFAIGKAEKNSRTSHAWVYWRNGGRWWILDCTDYTGPIAADKVSPDRYVPYYSFGKNGAYRHPATQVEIPPNSNVATTSAVGAADRKKPR